MKKRMVILLLCCVVSLTMSACSGTKTDGPDTQTEEDSGTDTGDESESEPESKSESESESEPDSTPEPIVNRYLKPTFTSVKPVDDTGEEPAYLDKIPKEYIEEKYNSYEPVGDGTEKVLLIKWRGMSGYIDEAYLLDLATGKQETVVEKKAPGEYYVTEVSVSGDGKRILISTTFPDNVIYRDNNQEINLRDVCEGTENKGIEGALYSDGILVWARTQNEEGMCEGKMWSYYWYSFETKSAEHIFDIAVKPDYTNDYRGFHTYGDACATSVEDGKLVVWNLRTGEHAETSVREISIDMIFSINSTHLLVLTKENILITIEKATGETKWRSEKPVDLEGIASYGTYIHSTGEVYLELWRHNEDYSDSVYEYYELDL